MIKVRVRVKYIIIIAHVDSIFIQQKTWERATIPLRHSWYCREQDSEAKVYGFKPWSGQQDS